MKETERERERVQRLFVCLFSVKDRERERERVCWRVCNVLRICVYVVLSTNL